MKLEITHHEKRKCISFTYGDNHQFTIFDVEKDSVVLELFGRIEYALNKGFDMQINTEE